MKGKIGLILAAAFGGVLSNIIDVATRLQQRPPDLPSGTYWIGFLIWAVCGAGVALVWGEKNLKKAFYLGIGLPALIQLNVGMTSGRPPNKEAFLRSFVSSAIAQPAVVTIQGRTIRLIRNKDAPADPGYSVIFLFQDANREEKYPINFNSMPIAVPIYATTIAVQYQGYKSPTIQLPNQHHASLTLEVFIRE